MKFDALILAVAGLTTAAHSQALGPAPATGDAAAASSAGWRLTVAPLTLHYHHDPEHRPVYMLGLERQRADGMSFGASWFRNSFGQPSAYLYLGQRFRPVADCAPLFVQLTAGLLYGYLPPYDDKVPLNVHGFSPGVVAGVGWQMTPRLSAQINVLGTAALMLQFSAELR